MDAWGKFDESSGRFHRLEHHCADVAACFEALLRDGVLRERFVRAAGGNEFTDTTAARLAFLAYLHDFGKLNDYPDLRPCQRAVAAAPVDQPLLILESETGSGKTEAAILRFAALQHAGLVDGLYFAVPTRAAAKQLPQKQLHGRVSRALERLFPPAARVETVLAVPGYLVAGDAEVHEYARGRWNHRSGAARRVAREVGALPSGLALAQPAAPSVADINKACSPPSPSSSPASGPETGFPAHAGMDPR